MSTLQDTRCKAILDEIDDLIGTSSYDGIDYIMGCDDGQLRKIIALLFQRQICTAKKVFEFGAKNMLGGLLRELEKDDDALSDRIEKRLQSLERGFRIVCEDKEINIDG